MPLKNVIVAQSGGPSPVINNSLRGVIETCAAHADAFGRVYGAFHGIEGILKEELIDISAQDKKEISLLGTTPAAGAIGTCRYKLKPKQEKDFDRIIEVFKAHDIACFFYIGGNDSMDTANKVSMLAKEKGLHLVCTGVPKTIDNDVGDSRFKLIDHTPGYGSVARYWAHIVQNANQENMGSCPSDPVLVMQAMGRKIGYITAASRLADPQRQMPLLIFMPEAALTLDDLADAVNDMLKRHGRAIVVVSEGLDVGDLGRLKDSFGHTMFSASSMTVERIVVNHLNKVGLAVRGAARGNMPGTDQRDTAIYASTVDLHEAYAVGRKAVEIALKEGTGWMSTIIRKQADAYDVYYDKVPLEEVANSERTFPQEWISSDKVDVTDDFVKYARPLIGEGWPKVPLADGLQRFARFKMIFAEKKCPGYVPEAYEK